MDKTIIDQVTADGTTDNVYTFRSLCATDVFLMFKILGKIGINEFAECFGKDSVQKLLTGENSVENFAQSLGITVALEAVNVIMGNLPKCETEIFQMLSNTSNLSVDEVRHLDFSIFTSMVIDFVKKDEFKDFVKVVSKLFK